MKISVLFYDLGDANRCGFDPRDGTNVKCSTRTIKENNFNFAPFLVDMVII